MIVGALPANSPYIKTDDDVTMSISAPIMRSRMMKLTSLMDDANMRFA